MRRNEFVAVNIKKITDKATADIITHLQSLSTGEIVDLSFVLQKELQRRYKDWPEGAGARPVGLDEFSGE